MESLDWLQSYSYQTSRSISLTRTTFFFFQLERLLNEHPGIHDSHKHTAVRAMSPSASRVISNFFPAVF